MDARRAIGYTISEIMGIGAIALLLYYLQLSSAASVSDVWAVDRVVAYVLMFVGTLLVFLPFCMSLRLGPVWVLGAASWTLLGYVLLFTPAPDKGTTGIFTYVAFLGLVFAALACTLSVPMGALSSRFLPPAAAPWSRALRQGSLLALFIVSTMAMSPLGVLNWLNVMLAFMVVALAEFFFLARG